MLKGIHASPPQSVFSIQSLPENHRDHENEKGRQLLLGIWKCNYVVFAGGKETEQQINREEKKHFTRNYFGTKQ